MTGLFLIITYTVIASASVFGLIVVASKTDIIPYSDPDAFDLLGYIIAGILWPVCLLPCLAFIGAKWYINNKEQK